MNESLNARWARITLVVLGCAAGLAATEVTLRAVVPEAVRLRGTRLVLPRNQETVYPHVHLRGCPSEVHLRHNSLGFRGENPPSDFDQRMTLVAVGGSTTECRYLTDGETWPEVLGRRLQIACPSVWINNAGLDGHSSFGHYFLTQQALVPLKPKVILYLIGINDIERSDINRRDVELLRPSWTDRVAAHSAVISFLQNAWRHRRALEKGLVDGDIDVRRLVLIDGPTADQRRRKIDAQGPYLDGFEKRLESLIHLCRDHGITPVFLTQPTLYGFGKDDVTRIDLARIHVFGIANGRAAWEVVELYNARTQEVGKRNNVLVIDLARNLPKSSRYFYDFIHFTTAGAAKVADVTAAELEPYLAKTFPGACSSARE